MKPIFKNGQFYLDNTSFPLLSGEVHYWRLDPTSWLTVLRRVKEMGIKILATYICWDFHELAPGKFDFNGATDPRRNLVAFLDLASELGFWIILRPGPYIYSEWRNNGVPDDVAKDHRLSNHYLNRAQIYLRAVVDAIRPYLAQSGGKVILLQADNEIDPWPSMYTEALGLGRHTGPFHEFLSQRYQSVDRLNDGWGTNFGSINEARALCALPGNALPLMKIRYQDYVRFQHWYGRKVADWTVQVLRELGVEIPIYLNAYNGFGTQSWSMLEAAAELCGPDIYPTNEFRNRPDEHQKFMESVRNAASLSKFPYIAEFESGIWHNWHYDVGSLTLNHYRLTCVSALLGGIKGWNWYMLVNRDNWYQSPINEWGRTRPELFELFSQIVSVFEQVNPSSLDHLCELGVTFDTLQRGTTRPGKDILAAIYAGNFDYQAFDLEKGECDLPVVFYANDHWLSRAEQECLLDYVNGGGHLVFLQTLPLVDESFQPLNLLQLSAPEGAILCGDQVEISMLDHTFTIPAQSIQTFENGVGTPIMARRISPSVVTAEESCLQFRLQNDQQYTVGFSRQVGKGRITQVGLPASSLLLEDVGRACGLNLTLPLKSFGCSTALYRRGDEYFLMACNAGDVQTALSIPWDRISAEVAESATVTDLFLNKTWKISSNHPASLDFSLPPKDATILRITRRKPK